MKNKLYSYIRMSTAKQLKDGDSYRRQLANTKKFALKNNLEFDDKTTFKDLGISSYRGKNLHKGALGQLLEAIKEGRIEKGSYLCIEHFDRLSRMEPLDALNIFTAIVNSGVILVTLMDGQIYDKKSIRKNPMLLFGSIQYMWGAHQESLNKSERLKETWLEKRKLISEGIKLTKHGPGWLKLSEDRKKFNLISDRVEVVKKIYSLTLKGYGRRSISKLFNEERIPTFGRSSYWHDSTIAKYLSTRAVLGEFQPKIHPYGTNVGSRAATNVGLIKDYYPQIIDEDTFDTVQRTIKSRSGKAGKKDSKFSNIFRHLVVCGQCHMPKSKTQIKTAIRELRNNPDYRKLSDMEKVEWEGEVSQKQTTMVFGNKGKPNEQYLYCLGHRSGFECENKSYWNYNYLEKSILTFCKHFDINDFLRNKDNNKTEIKMADKKIERYNDKISTLKVQNRKLTKIMLDKGKSVDHLLDTISENDDQIRVYREDLKTFENERDVYMSRVENSVKSKDQIEGLVQEINDYTNPKETFELRMQLNESLKTIINKIELFNSGRFGDGIKEFVIHYHNGEITSVIPNPDDPTEYEVVRERDKLGRPIKKDRIKLL